MLLAQYCLLLDELLNPGSLEFGGGVPHRRLLREVEGVLRLQMSRRSPPPALLVQTGPCALQPVLVSEQKPSGTETTHFSAGLPLRVAKIWWMLYQTPCSLGLNDLSPIQTPK